MKKYLIFMLGIISFLGINTVSAKEIYLEYDTHNNVIKPLIDNIGYEKLDEAINSNINYYTQNLSYDYPYYFISLYVDYTHSNNTYNFDNKLKILLTAFDDETHKDYFGRYFEQSFDSSYLLSYSPYTDYVQIVYNLDTNTTEYYGSHDNYSHHLQFGKSIDFLNFYGNHNYYFPYHYYYSNFDLYYRGDLLTDSSSDRLTYLDINDILYFPLLDDSSKYSVHNANTKFLIEPYYLYDENSSLKDETYTSINLNEYSYVALSLKDYNTTPENNYSTFANFYVKGQLCITPVYNYGMTERKDILTGSQIQGCSKYYNDFTLTRMYILKDDVENNAIYYLKTHDTSKENLVKINTSLFNITYITEENKDAPEVLVNGRYYLTIPYDNLTDSATISEELGYISGTSCPVGDFNCYNEYNTDNMFKDVFDKPLETLKTVWSAIISIFALIAEFIALLPPVMQAFLLLSFSVGIALGIIKIIL